MYVNTIITGHSTLCPFFIEKISFYRYYTVMKEIREINLSWEEHFFDKDEQAEHVTIHELYQDGDALHYIHTLLNHATNEKYATEKFGLIVLRDERSHCCKIRWQDGSHSLFHLLKRRFFGSEDEIWFYPYLAPATYKDRSFLESVCSLLCKVTEVACDSMVLVSLNTEVIERFERREEIAEFTAEDIFECKFYIRFDLTQGLHISVSTDKYPCLIGLYAHGGFGKNAQGRMQITQKLQTSICCVNVVNTDLIEAVLRQR